jgi:predicted alpha/beta-fold hydrolase
VVNWAREKWPERRLFGAGFSLGANILTNYMAEEGNACPLEAAVLVSNPWNLEVANSHLKSTWIGKEIYSATMGKGLRKLFERYRSIERI